MYMRLKRSELSNVGKDVFTRTMLYFSNIITEEVSDRVALRILSEFYQEIEDGTHTAITRSVVEPRQTEIEDVLAAQLRQTLTDPSDHGASAIAGPAQPRERRRGVRGARAVPLPNVVLKPAVHASAKSSSTRPSRPSPQRSTRPKERRRCAKWRAPSSMILFYGPGLAQFESLVKEITLQVLDHMMDVVKVKKWALARRSDSPPAHAVGTGGA